MNLIVARNIGSTELLKRLLALASALVLATTLSAQAVAPVKTPPLKTASGAQPQPAKGGDGADEVVEMSVFEVSANAQTGYLANESVTGTRLPTKVMDLPFVLESITSEFMEDFAVVDMSEIVEGGVVTDDPDGGGTSTIRGISANGQLFNGFWMPAGTNIPLAFTDRTEILKGPSAAIYGQTSPGGIVNRISKQPKNKRSTKLTLGYGNYDQLRARVETTGPVTKKTSYLAAFQVDDRKFDQPWRRNTAYAGGASILHKFDSTSQLRIDILGSLERNDAPANRVPYLYDSKYKNSYTDPETGKLYESTGRYYGLATELNSTSGTGPESWKDTDTFSIFAIYEKRINTVFSYRLGANFTSKHAKGFNTQALSVYDPDPTHQDPTAAGDSKFTGSFHGLSRTMANDSSFIAPRYDINNQDNGGIQGDLLAKYNLFGNRKIEATSLFTFDFSTRYRYEERWAMPATIKSPSATPTAAPSTDNGVDPNMFPWDPTTIGTVVRGRLVTPEWFWANYWMPIVTPLTGDTPYVDSSLYPGYDIYHVPSFDKGSYIQRSQKRSRRDIYGLMFRQRIIFWQKLIVYASARFDNVTYKYETISLPSWSLKSYPQYAQWWDKDYLYRNKTWHSSAFKPSAGFNYRARRWLSVFGNYSSSFNPNDPPINGKQKVLTVLPNETAWGYDYGVKFSILNEKLTGTLTGFYISQQHISRTDLDPITGESTTLASGKVLSRGFEATVNYFVTPAWFIKAGYYHTNTKWVYTGLDGDLLGRSYPGVPYDIVSFATKYTFQSGFLKGMNVGGKYQYVSICPAEKGKAFAVTSPAGYDYQVKGYNSGVRDIMVPSVYLVDLFVNYSWNLKVFGAKTKQSFGINIKNALDEKYVTLSRGVGDRRTIMGTYAIQF